MVQREPGGKEGAFLVPRLVRRAEARVARLCLNGIEIARCKLVKIVVLSCFMVE
jgi:hypothetical protein